MGNSSVIKSAKLSLYTVKAGGVGESKDDAKLLLYPVIKEWSEDEVTFASSKTGELWGNIFQSNMSQWAPDKTRQGGGLIDLDYRVTSNEGFMDKPIGKWITFDIKEIIALKVKNPSKYHGVMIYDGRLYSYTLGEVKEGAAFVPHEYDYAGKYNNHSAYCSSEYSKNKSFRPKLEIEYEAGENPILNSIGHVNSIAKVNHSNGVVSISNSSTSNLQVSIVNLQGQLLESKEISAMSNISINSSSWSSNVVIVKLTNNSATTTQKLFIK